MFMRKLFTLVRLGPGGFEACLLIAISTGHFISLSVTATSTALVSRQQHEDTTRVIEEQEKQTSAAPQLPYKSLETLYQTGEYLCGSKYEKCASVCLMVLISKVCWSLTDSVQEDERVTLNCAEMERPQLTGGERSIAYLTKRRRLLVQTTSGDAQTTYTEEKQKQNCVSICIRNQNYED